MDNLTRREFAASAAAAFQPAPPARCTLRDAQGNPAPPALLGRFHLCDFRLRVFPTVPKITPGEAAFTPPGEPFRIGVAVTVPGFGNIVAYADNRGRGHTAASFAKGALDLTAELPADRLATVRQYPGPVPPGAARRIEAAEALLKKGRFYESLAESLWAGEELVFARAQAEIAKRGPRPGFLFGCNAFGFPRHGEPYARRFEELFNFATLPFYLRATQPVYGKPNYGAAEKILAWTSQRGIIAKGHPLVWFYPQTTPEWLKGKPYEEAKRLALEYSRNTVRRFRHGIHAWDIINEAHVQNSLDFTLEQQLDITAGAARAAREGDPTCFRVLNCCCTWNDYMSRTQQKGRQNVWDYVKTVLDAKVDFEALGLQYYYSGRDMLEYERSLDSFAGFGKPVHITELGVASAQQEEPTQHGQRARFPWHGDVWTESMQADWIEQFYTLAYSKPYIEAVTWWDLSDPAFIPHGGLLKPDLEPKESFHRLKKLLASWREG